MSTNTQDSRGSTFAMENSVRSLFERFKRALGPSLPGIVLDLVDALSLTKYAGPFVSFPAGLAVGVWLSSYYRFSRGWKVLISICSGLYTMTPGTESIPLATILTCLGRFVESSPEPASQPSSPSTVSGDATLSENSAEPSPAATVSTFMARGDRQGAKCPECGSTALKYGQVGQRFWPAGSSMWAKGHEVNAFACLECGFVGHYLSSTDLDALDRPAR